MSARAKSILPTFVVFLLAFVAIPLTQLSWLGFIPGDLGDSRLNNYFLENIYQFLAGGSRSLWHLSFFAPYPYVVGFSDNLFGASPVYLLARLATGESDTAFQLWFLAGYAANFAAALYAARRLGLGLPAAATMALIFTFALPTSAHMSHVQLHYRFGIPLSTLYLLLFLEERRVSRLASAALWLAWQFYCGIYMGFFAALLLGCIASCFIAAGIAHDLSRLRRFPAELRSNWANAAASEAAFSLIGLGISVAAMAVLIFPYLQVSRLYQVQRSWADIEPMLPRWRSYLMSDGSRLWAPLLQRLPDVPMRHEHQMFVGIVPALLAIAGLVIAIRQRLRTALLLAGACGLMMVLTLDIAGHSLWSYLYRLPLASAIRAMSRIDQVLLFPIGYLAGIAVDRFSRGHSAAKAGTAIIVALIVVEAALVSMPRSAKADWRARLAAIEAIYPGKTPASSIVFIAQRNDPITDEIDVMWAALRHGQLTLNGYSGLMPSGFSDRYAAGCEEIIRRVTAYVDFAKRTGLDASYSEIMGRVVPIGFRDCEEEELRRPRQFSVSKREYSADEFRQLSYRLVGTQLQGARKIVSIALINNSSTPIAARSAVGAPVRLSWRFVEADGTAVSGWDARQDLPFDVPGRDELLMKIAVPLNAGKRGRTLQISSVQEGRFWAHNIGVNPLSVPWD